MKINLQAGLFSCEKKFARKYVIEIKIAKHGVYLNLARHESRAENSRRGDRAHEAYHDIVKGIYRDVLQCISSLCRDNALLYNA